MDRKWVKLWSFIPSVRFICFLPVRDPDGGGWMVKWKKLLSTSKTTFFSDTSDTQDTQQLPEFWDVLRFRGNWPTKHKKSIARHYAYYPSQGAGATSGGSHLKCQQPRDPGESQSRYEHEGTFWKINGWKPTNHLFLERKMIWSKYPWWCSILLFRGVIMSWIEELLDVFVSLCCLHELHLKWCTNSIP